MKICGDKRCLRLGESLPASDFPLNRTMPDKLGFYCRQCSVRRTQEYRKRLRARRPAKKILKAVQRKGRVLASVRSVIEAGPKTREEIRAQTGLSYDLLGATLAELVWEVRTVRIQRVGSERLFVIAA